MLKITLISLICIFLSSIVRHHNAEISTLISVSGGVVIFLLILDYISKIITEILEFTIFNSIGIEHFALLIKIVGVGYITEFTADIAEDMGNKIMASRVILGGKVIVCFMALPVIKKLFSLFLSFS